LWNQSRRAATAQGVRQFRRSQQTTLIITLLSQAIKN